MSKYIIEGGTALKGEVEVFGAKNSVFKLMLAACLSDEVSNISNICFIRNVYLVKEMLESLGGSVGFGEERSAIIHAKNLAKFEVAQRFGKESRASAMIIPILLHRFGKAKVPIPGGDEIGVRSLDRHYDGLKALGVEIKVGTDFIEASSPNGLIGTSYTFAKSTHTGTETLVLAACLAKGTTILKNAAAEPEVEDLINFLNLMGAKIQRRETKEIQIEGVDKLNGASYRVMPDQNEAVTFACCALATKGDVLVKDVFAPHMQAFLDKVQEARGGVEIGEKGIRFFFKEPLQATNIDTAPFPGFKTDWQALWATLMTQAEGESVIHETIYESRFAYADFLKKMGAEIDLFNPEVVNPDQVYNFNLSDLTTDSFHAARISGPTNLIGTKMDVPDIRAGATLTLAALIASGQTELNGVEMIERGYENLEGRLSKLGARIGKAD